MVVVPIIGGCESADDVVAQHETTVAPAPTEATYDTFVESVGSTIAYPPVPVESRVQFRPVLEIVGEGAVVPDGAVPGEPDDTGAVTYYVLGPALLDERAIESAEAQLQDFGDHRWVVDVVLLPGRDGIDRFNQAARLCNLGDPVCPPVIDGDTGGLVGQLAVVVDGVVISAPAINATTFIRDQIQVSGPFTEESANALAKVLAP